MVGRSWFRAESTFMKGNLLTIALVLAAGGYFAYGALGSNANSAALETASAAENRVSLAVTGMT